MECEQRRTLDLYALEGCGKRGVSVQTSRIVKSLVEVQIHCRSLFFRR